MRDISSRARALVLAAVVVLLIWFGFYQQTLVALVADAGRLAKLDTAIHHGIMLKMSVPAMQASLRKYRAGGIAREIYLAGHDPTLLAAELQRRASGIIEECGVTLISSRTSPIEREQGTERIGLDLDVAATSSALQSLLYRLETATPLLTVARLHIEVPQGGGATSTSDPQPNLSVHLHVVAYAQDAV